MQCKQTVLLCGVAQINTQRSLPTLISRAQPGNGKTGHGALSLLCAVQAQLCWDCKTLEIPQQKEDGDRHSTWQLELSPKTNPEVTTHRTNHLSFLAGILAIDPDGI